MPTDVKAIKEHLTKFYYFAQESWFSALANGNDITLRMLLNHRLDRNSLQ
jgi:hypothetical protein